MLSIREGKAHYWLFFFFFGKVIFVTGFLIILIQNFKIGHQISKLTWVLPSCPCVTHLDVVEARCLGGCFWSWLYAWEKQKTSDSSLSGRWALTSLHVIYAKCTDTCISLYQTPRRGKITEEVVIFTFISKTNKGSVNQHIKYPAVFKTSSCG